MKIRKINLRPYKIRTPIGQVAISLLQIPEVMEVVKKNLIPEMVGQLMRGETEQEYNVKKHLLEVILSRQLQLGGKEYNHL